MHPCKLGEAVSGTARANDLYILAIVLMKKDESVRVRETQNALRHNITQSNQTVFQLH